MIKTRIFYLIFFSLLVLKIIVFLTYSKNDQFLKYSYKFMDLNVSNRFQSTVIIVVETRMSHFWPKEAT